MFWKRKPPKPEVFPPSTPHVGHLVRDDHGVVWRPISPDECIAKFRKFRDEWARYEELCQRLKVTTQKYPRDREQSALIECKVIINPLDQEVNNETHD